MHIAGDAKKPDGDPDGGIPFLDNEDEYSHERKKRRSLKRRKHTRIRPRHHVR
jgi:hypothetical protein